MPFDFAQAEQMLNGSERHTFFLKVSLKNRRNLFLGSNISACIYF